MATAKKKFDDASQRAHRPVHQVDALRRATASSAPPATLTQEPAFEGEVKVRPQRAHRDGAGHLGDGKVYAKLPLQTKYAVIDPPSTAPPTPPTSPTRRTGLSALLTQLDGLKKGERDAATATRS